MPTAAEVADLLEDAMAAAVLQATVEGYSTDEVNSAEIRARILGAYQTAYSTAFGAPAGSLGAVVGASSIAAVGLSQKVAVGSALGTSVSASLVTNFQSRTVSVAGAATVTAVGAAQKVAIGGAVGSSAITGLSDAFALRILSGIVSAQSEAAGWNALRATIPGSAVVRTSDTQVTITLPAFASYVISADETLTVTLPTSVLLSGVPLVAAPTLVIANNVAPAGVAVGASVVTAVGASSFAGVGSAVGSSIVTSVLTSSVGVVVGSAVVAAIGTQKRVGVASAMGSAAVSGFTGSGTTLAHAYFDGLIQRTDWWKGWSLRPAAGHPAQSDPYFTNQLDYKALGGFCEWTAPDYKGVTYSPGTDTDPNKQDAAKILIPYIWPPTHTASQCSLSGQPYLPLNTTVGQIYLFIWDTYWTSSYISNTHTLSNHKAFNFQTGGSRLGAITYEIQTNYGGGAGWYRPPTYNGATDVGAITLRGYADGGSGGSLGPNVVPGVVDPIQQNPPPSAGGGFLIKPNLWVRTWFLYESVAADWDRISLWCADETTGPRILMDRIQIEPRIGTPQGVIKYFYIEFNTSFDDDRRPYLQQDFVAYMRNFAVLLNPPSDLVGAGLMVRPVRG